MEYNSHLTIPNVDINKEDLTNTTKNKLTEMLESCLQKSKDLISENENRKKEKLGS